MKRFVLTVCVVAIFVAYTLVFRHHTSKLVLSPALAKNQSNTSATQGSQTASTQSTTTPVSQTAAQYKDGTYIGSTEDAFYGNVEVEVTISSGKLTDVRFLQAPDDSPNSVNINQQARPLLQQEAIHAQSAHVDIISGATNTSQAFIQSLSSALSQAT